MNESHGETGEGVRARREQLESRGGMETAVQGTACRIRREAVVFALELLLGDGRLYMGRQTRIRFPILAKV